MTKKVRSVRIALQGAGAMLALSVVVTASYARSEIASEAPGDPHRPPGAGSLASPATWGPEAAPASYGTWWETASREIRAMEYRVSPGERGLQAPNRAHGIRTYFRDRGIEVGRRDGRGGVWSWTTQALGRGDELTLLDLVAPAYEGSRVEYVREGLIEQYANGEGGLAQIFLLPEPPSGSGQLRLIGTLAGDAEDAPALQHGDFAARDAVGRRLASRFSVHAGVATLVIDDRNAEYPIRLERDITSPPWTVDGGQDGAELGFSLSTVGDVNGDGYSDVVISVPLYDAGQTNEGRVYVYYGSGNGLSQGDYWVAEGNRANAKFGYSASTAGDVNGDGFHDLIVGAPGYDNQDGTFGHVFVYHGRAEGMGGAIAWGSANPHPGSLGFGSAVSTAGDVNGDGFDDVLIGDYQYVGDDDAEGRAWVHLGSGGGVQDEPTWFADGNEPFCEYGKSLATAGDVNADGYADILIGAGAHNGNGMNAGRAYLYLGSVSGPSTTPNWYKDGDAAHDRYGSSVARAGDVNGDGYGDVIVGAPAVTNDQTAEGRAFLYLGTDASSGLEWVPAWWDEGDVSLGVFGASVATAGDVNGDGLGDVLVGAPGFSEDELFEGRVFLYYGSRTGLEQDPRWWADGNQEEPDFASYVMTAGDVNGDGFSDFLVGAPAFDDTYVDEGRAFVYLGSGDGPREAAGWVVESNQANANAGTSVANAGDVNGDGYEELLVGVPMYDNGQSDEGVVFLFLGHGYGPSIVPDWYAESNQAGAMFGLDVAGGGDVNGDGYDDVLIGAPLYDGTHTDAGSAFLWPGGPSGGPMGNPANASWTAGGLQPAMQYGRSVAFAGDVNGDGYGDVIIGGPMASYDQDDEGTALLYLGGDGGLNAAPAWSGQGDQDFAYYGFAVASAGDVNGDGFSDLLVGAPAFNTTESDAGKVMLYNGSMEGPSPTPSWYVDGDEADAHLGYSVGSAGDFDGDGYSDVLVGVPGMDSFGPDGGFVLLWLGGSEGPVGNDLDDMDWGWTTSCPEANLGHTVSTPGDVNGDGFADFIIGAPTHDDPDDETQRPGMAWFIPGCPSDDWPDCMQLRDVALIGSQHNALFGYAVDLADVNGDGFSDVAVGANGWDQGQTNEGRAFLFYGNGSRGLPRTPNQMRTDFSSPIALLGVSDTEDAFGLQAYGRTPGGRGDVWMEWEVKPLGTPFDGMVIQSGDIHNTGEPDPDLGSRVLLSELVTGLGYEPTYHWRLRVASLDPYFPHTPWFSPSGNAASELDLRTRPSTPSSVGSTAVPGVPVVDIRPNPFRTGTTVRYLLPKASEVDLAVYNVEGRLVRRLVSGRVSPGLHQVDWDGRSDHGRLVTSGVYWVRITAGEEETTKSVVRVE